MTDGHRVEPSPRRPDAIPSGETVPTYDEHRAFPSIVTPVTSNPIAAATNTCAQKLLSKIASEDLSASVSTDLKTQLSRFKIWGGYLGVYIAGQSSTDHRLQDDSNTSAVIISMLTRLTQKIEVLVDQQLP